MKIQYCGVAFGVLATVLVVGIAIGRNTHPVFHKQRFATVTNYVTMPKEFGPDGYGFRHLRKEDHDLVRDCMMRMDEPWKRGTFLEDLTVTKTVTHEAMTANEIMEILSKQPNVAHVTLRMGATRPVFSLDYLAYPQYAHHYQLTKSQWRSLQDYCRLALISSLATDGIIEHWKQITNGIVPYGLKVGDE